MIIDKDFYVFKNERLTGLVGKKSCENSWGLCTFPVYSIQKIFMHRENQKKNGFSDN